MLRVMFDMDGVLADFVEAFTRLANEMFGTPHIRTVHQPTWSFAGIGMTEEQVSAVWDELKATPNWWLGLLRIVTSGAMHRISELSKVAEVYFVTRV